MATIIYYVLKKQEFKCKKFSIFIAIFLIFSLSIFFSDPYNYTPILSSVSNSFEIGTNQIILIISIVLFIYAMNIKDRDLVNLKCPSLFRSRLGQIEIGRVVKKDRVKHKFFLPIEDLERHMFVCGATGTGKSNFIQNFLLNFTKYYDIPIIIVEFKGEYHYLQEELKNLLIIKPGENFSINIFDAEGADPEIHAERIFDILKSGQFLDDESEYSPQMEKVLVDILKIACESEKRQNWDDFYQECNRYLDNFKDKIPFLHQTITSITNRIRRFSLGPLKEIFGKKHELKVKNLFQKNVLFDLSSIIRLGGEKEDALFFLNMILKYLWDYNLQKGSRGYKGIKHITLVEDAQYFAPKSVTNQTKLSTYLEDIALLLRGTGECLISIATRPQVSDEILANCGILVTFKNHMQKKFMCELLNLEEKDEDYLSILEKGQCLIRINSIKRPFLLNIPLIKRRYPTIDEIERNNNIILKTHYSYSSKIQISDDFKDLEDFSFSQTEESDKLEDIKSFKNLIDELYRINLEKNKLESQESEQNTSNETKFRYCKKCGSFHNLKLNCKE